MGSDGLGGRSEAFGCLQTNGLEWISNKLALDVEMIDSLTKRLVMSGSCLKSVAGMAVYQERNSNMKW